MDTGPRAEESSFSWPPSNADLAAIDVMEFTGPRSPATERAAAIAGARDASPPRPRSRVPFSRARMLAWANASPRRPRAHHLLLLGLGMLVGMAVPDLGRQWSFGTRDTDVALANGTTSPDAARLLVMRATLRGEASRSMQVLPAADERAAEAASDPTANAETASATVDDASQAMTGNAIDDVRAGEATLHSAPAASTPDGGSTLPTPRPSAPDPLTAPVHGVMRSFEAAWTRMDTAATLAVWPTAKVDVLTRAFTDMREQRLRLAPCRVARTGTRATATCEGTLRYRPRVGDHSTRVRRDRWDFDLEQSGRGVWQIRRVKAH